MIRLIVRAGDDGAEGSPGGNLSAPRIHMNSHLLRGARIGQLSWRGAIVAAPGEELPMIRLIVRAGDDGAEGSPGGNLRAPRIHTFEVLGSAHRSGVAPSWQRQMRSCR